MCSGKHRIHKFLCEDIELKICSNFFAILFYFFASVVDVIQIRKYAVTAISNENWHTKHVYR